MKNNKALLVSVALIVCASAASGQGTIYIGCDRLQMNFFSHPIMGTGPAQCTNVTITLKQDIVAIDEICDIRGSFSIMERTSTNIKFARGSIIGELNRMNGGIDLSQVDDSGHLIRTVTGSCRTGKPQF